MCLLVPKWSHVLYKTLQKINVNTQVMCKTKALCKYLVIISLLSHSQITDS